MSPLPDAIGAIPVWVYALFALLVWLGLRARKTRPARLPLLLATPVVFAAWSLTGIVATLALRPALAGVLGAGAALGLGLAAASAHLDPRIEHEGGRAVIRGSSLPLIRNLTIFAAKFAVSFAAATRPELRDPLMLWNVALSGLTIGYFLGWSIRLIRGYGLAGPLPVVPPGHWLR